MFTTHSIAFLGVISGFRSAKVFTIVKWQLLGNYKWVRIAGCDQKL